MFLDSTLNKAFNEGNYDVFLKNAVKLYQKNNNSIKISRSPMIDECYEFMMSAVANASTTTGGHIYIAANSNNPNLLKIGLAKDVAKRERSLNTAGVVGKIEIVWHIKSDLPSLAEKLAHYRLNNNNWQKEFFEVDLQTAIDVCTRSVNDIQDILHNLFHSAASRDFNHEYRSHGLGG